MYGFFIFFLFFFIFQLLVATVTCKINK